MPDTITIGPDADAEIEEAARGDRGRRRTLILATALSVTCAVVATTLAVVLRRRLGAAGGVAPVAVPRPAPVSTINVNWGFALFGTNVLAERRRSGRLRGCLSRRR